MNLIERHKLIIDKWIENPVDTILVRYSETLSIFQKE